MVMVTGITVALITAQLLLLSFIMQCAEVAGTLCHQDDAEPPLDRQLAVYNPPQFLQPLQEREKRVVFGGHEWVIKQDWEGVGVASVIWEPALALCRYLESVSSDIVLQQRIIELGAGTGLVGLVAHALGAATVVITDRNPEPAKLNLNLNSDNLDPQRPVVVRELTWGQDVTDFHPPYDVILAADVVYIEKSFLALIQSLEQLSSLDTIILLSWKYRYERDVRFLQMLSERFVLKVVWSSGDLSIHSIRKRTDWH